MPNARPTRSPRRSGLSRSRWLNILACSTLFFDLFTALEVVKQLWIAVHREARRVTGAAVMRAVPHLFRDKDDVALRRVEDRQVADLVVDRALEDEPELGRHFVEVTFVLRVV